MIQYRDHRGSLEDSMKTMTYMHDIGMLAAHLSLQQGRTVRPDMIGFQEYGTDSRVGWDDCYLVTVEGNAVGFGDGKLEQPRGKAVSLNEEAFEHLVRGGTLVVGDVTMILQDIGFVRMLQLINEAMVDGAHQLGEVLHYDD